MGRARSEKHAGMPPRMIKRQRRQRAYFYYASPGSDRREIPLGSNYAEALARYHAIRAEGCRIAVPHGTAKALHKSMVKNARAKGIPVALTVEDVQSMLAASGNVCAVSGIQFDATQYAGRRIRPWMPSIDRIQPGGPYSRENTRIVCAAVNISMNQFGEANFLKIAAATVLRRRLLRSATDRCGADDLSVCPET